MGDLYVIAPYMINNIAAIQGAVSPQINRKDLQRNVHWANTERQTAPCKTKNKLRYLSSGISRRVLCWLVAGALKKPFASNSSAKKSKIFKIKAIESSEASVTNYLLTRCNIPEACNIHQHLYENIKYCKMKLTSEIPWQQTRAVDDWHLLSIEMVH